MNSGPATNIVFICEPGRLEIQSLLLAFSLQLNGIKDYRVCIPKEKKTKLNTNSLKLLSTWGAEVSFFTNNFMENRDRLLAGDAMSNKFYALEQCGNNKNILFLDSDIVCLKEVYLGEFATGIAAKPADVTVEANWSWLFMKTRITPTDRTIHTTEDNLETLPYFNSGVLWLNRNTSNLLIETWKELFFILSDPGILKRKNYNPFHRDQIALALALEKQNMSYTLIEKKYNYPARRNMILPTDTVFAHYHDAYTLNKHDVLMLQLSKMVELYPESEQVITQLKPWKYLLNNSKWRLASYKFEERVKGMIKRKIGSW